MQQQYLPPPCPRISSGSDTSDTNAGTTMNRLTFKIAFFVLVVVAVGAFNHWVINGPLLQHNTAMSMKQFGGTPSTAGDFEVAGYWLTFNTLYLVEVVAIALFGTLLFASHVLSLIFSKKD